MKWKCGCEHMLCVHWRWREFEDNGSNSEKKINNSAELQQAPENSLCFIYPGMQATNCKHNF